jgi:type IV pilus assembly protein PilV
MQSSHSRHFSNGVAQRGVSLIEILVTLMIVALAMLGAVGLQAHALRLNQGGQFRSQAVFLAGDLAERIEANKAAAVAGSYEVADTSAAPPSSTACTAGACSEDQLADYDLALWQNAVYSALPQASWLVERTTTGNPSVYKITIRWVDRGSNTTYGSGFDNTFSYVATRTVRE